MDTVRQSLAIVFVLALLWVALWFLRKRGWAEGRRNKTVQGLLELRCKLVLTPRHSIYLVQIGDRTVAIALHPEGVTFLGDADPSDACRREKGVTP